MSASEIVNKIHYAHHCNNLTKIYLLLLASTLTIVQEINNTKLNTAHSGIAL